MSQVPDDLRPILADLLLAVADDKLLLGHRNSEWTGLAPILEEDIAFSALAQDEMAHAKALYELTEKLVGRSADQLAFGRAPEEYRCVALVEVPDEFDWAVALARQFFCDHFDLLRLGRLARSSWKPLADLAARLTAEEVVHVQHVDTWIAHLGGGTDESRKRVQAALDLLAPLAPGLLEPVTDQSRIEDAGLYPAQPEMVDSWCSTLRTIAHDAGLVLDLGAATVDAPGGRSGHHTKHLTDLLDEMCEVFRLEPEGSW